MINFTDKQLDMLCEMSEIQFNWFKKYSPESEMNYEMVLRLNHQKMIDICSSCFDCSEEMVDLLFKSIIRDYTEMLNDLN